MCGNPIYCLFGIPIHSLEIQLTVLICILLLVTPIWNSNLELQFSFAWFLGVFLHRTTRTRWHWPTSDFGLPQALGRLPGAPGLARHGLGAGPGLSARRSLLASTQPGVRSSCGSVDRRVEISRPKLGGGLDDAVGRPAEGHRAEIRISIPNQKVEGAMTARRSVRSAGSRGEME